VAGFKRPLRGLRAANTLRLIEDLRAYPLTHSAFPFGDSVHLVLKDDEGDAALLEYLTAKGHERLDIQPIAPNIEDCFMELMTHKYPQEV
jgi:hypothetical protein